MHPEENDFTKIQISLGLELPWQMSTMNLLRKKFLGPKSALRCVPAVLVTENRHFLHTHMSKQNFGLVHSGLD